MVHGALRNDNWRMGYERGGNVAYCDLQRSNGEFKRGSAQIVRIKLPESKGRSTIIMVRLTIGDVQKTYPMEVLWNVHGEGITSSNQYITFTCTHGHNNPL